MKKTQKWTKLTAVFLAVLMIAMTLPFALAADPERVTLVLADPINDPPVASKVEPGARLRTSEITGGTLKVLETGEILTDIEWGRDRGSIFVKEEGMYTAIGYSNKYIYDYLTMDIYVGFVGGAIATEIVNVPTFEFVYDGETKWSDLDFSGMKAVEKGTDKEVAGTFEITDAYGVVPPDDQIMYVGYSGTYSITFTPDDLESYKMANTKVTINITKGVPQWKDNVTPVVTVPYGTAVGSPTFRYLLDDGSLVPSGVFISAPFCDSEGNRINGSVLDVGTYEGVYMLELVENQNWQGALLPVTVVVLPSEVEMKVTYNSQTHLLRVECPTRLLEGTIDVYIDGQLVFDDAELARSETMVNANWLEFDTTWKPANDTVNSTHTIKVVYNPTPTDQMGIVNGGCEISALYEADRKISVSDKQFDLYNDMKGFDAEKDILYAGDEVTVITSDTEFISWKITDAAGNPVSVEAIEGDVNASRFTFAMPELDLHIDYVTQYDLDHPEGNEDPESGNAFLDFLVRIINALRKVLQMLANILNLAQ